MQFFVPIHVQLLNSCYPSRSALLATGFDYSPNSHELSRLRYFASNHPGKLAKLGGELEKRLKNECRKASAGNTKARCLLLISLSIFRGLITECRRDVALLSPSLVASVEYSLSTLNLSDLEVLARTASVFTAWTTFTDGHLIGTDISMTQYYLSILRIFSSLSCIEVEDAENKYRTRLIGFAALAGAINSEALYNDTAQFQGQVSVLLRPVLVVLYQTNITTLNEQSMYVKEAPSSPYLAEFCTRPPEERRAASIHIHIDGDKGPTMKDVSEAALRGLFSLLSHANAFQSGLIMRSCFECLDAFDGWANVEHCCWVAQKIADWTQYQYRYVVPTWLVERLLEIQDEPQTKTIHIALTAMVTTIFSSVTPFVNLSSSDIMSNLISLLIRRASLNHRDPLLPAIVRSISSLGHHIYYSDQIQDLVGELIGGLVVVEVQGVYDRGVPRHSLGKSTAIRSLLASLTGLISTADKNESVKPSIDTSTPPSSAPKSNLSLHGTLTSQSAIDVRNPRRTRVPPYMWLDTLSLLCDEDFLVRADYSDALVFYLVHEMPKIESVSTMTRYRNPVSEKPIAHSGVWDTGGKLLNVLHAFVCILLTSPVLGLSSASSSPATANSSLNTSPASQKDTLVSQPQHKAQNSSEGSESPLQYLPAGRRSPSAQHSLHARKVSLIQRLSEHPPSAVATSLSANLTDFSNALKVLTTVHEQTPVLGLLTGIPMILALDSVTKICNIETSPQRILAIQLFIAKLWKVIAKVWKISDLEKLIDQSVSQKPGYLTLPQAETYMLHEGLQDRGAQTFASMANSCTNWETVDAEEALQLVLSSPLVQEATGLDRNSLHRRVSIPWSPEAVFRNSSEPPVVDYSRQGNSTSPLIKISPALMHIENLSLQSLARSTKGLGVMDLREALEGRSSMSTTALGRPPSVSTLDHAPSFTGGEGLHLSRSRSRAKKRGPSGSSEVKDVLSKLGLGRTNQNLLRASFPTPQKSENCWCDF